MFWSGNYLFKYLSTKIMYKRFMENENGNIVALAGYVLASTVLSYELNGRWTDK